MSGMSRRVVHITRKVLHIKLWSEWNCGPDIRKCTECGMRLWLTSDGTWTGDRKTWESPPAGYVSCREAEP